MRPYVSSRTGRLQWSMQRVSALLLIFFAFLHFAMQHFTYEAVSTGLSVAYRMDNRWWQAYYAVFIALALYHGINGLVGIINDYAPKQLWRNLIGVLLWTGTVIFLAIALINLAAAPKLGAVKTYYATSGMAEGTSAGNPPTIPIEYSFREELRELHLLSFYLEHHVHRTEDDPKAIGAIFGNSGKTAESPEAIKALAAKGGERFDAWLQDRIEAGPTGIVERDRYAMFSSTYEYAVWAANVRRANARERGDQAIVDRLSGIPDYQPTLH
ncbi:MAG: hypothetical protein ACOCXA_06690 [Planctomycetota bacterium]